MVEKIERIIQYYGLLRPPSNIIKAKWWRLTADIIRPQVSEYRNDRYPVPQGFWGYVQSMHAGRVLQTYRISYKNEILAYNIDSDLFLQQNVSCSLEAFLTTAVNFAIALNLPPIQRNNPIKDWRNLSLPIDEFRIRLLAEQTVFKFTLDYETQENCEVPLSVPAANPPDRPDPPPTELPATTPNTELPPISQAYDGNEDGGLTYNPDPDGGTGIPVTLPCQLYTMTFSVTDAVTGAVSVSTAPVYGVVTGTWGEFSVANNQWELGVFEGAIAPDGSCIQGVKSRVFSGASNDSTIQILNILPVN